jgi:hypothetical protein
MAKAGPARAAGRLGPKLSAGRPGDTGRVVPRQRTVRIETRTGSVRTKKGEPTPAVELELGGSERLLEFVIGADAGPGLLATIEKRVAWEKRKTIDWDWYATVEVELPGLDRARRRKAAS